MRLLAIDTSLEACSVGISAGGGRVLSSEVIGRGHAERLMGMIEAAMAEAGLGFAELDRIAVTVGPGSFTGLRVGIAAARGLALVVGCEMVGIGTLAVHAASARAGTGPVSVFAALDARRDEIYGQLFAGDGAALTEPAVGPVAAFLPQIGPDTLLAASGAEIVASALGGGRQIVHRRSAPDLATLVGLAEIAPPSAAPPRPLYLRAPDAKPQATARVARR